MYNFLISLQKLLKQIIHSDGYFSVIYVQILKVMKNQSGTQTKVEIEIF